MITRRRRWRSLDRDAVEADRGGGDPEDLRDAFDALAGWDGASAIAGVARADDPTALFESVCTAMPGDEGRVPPDTVRALLRGGGSASAAVDAHDRAARGGRASRRVFPEDG